MKLLLFMIFFTFIQISSQKPLTEQQFNLFLKIGLTRHNPHKYPALELIEFINTHLRSADLNAIDPIGVITGKGSNIPSFGHTLVSYAQACGISIVVNKKTKSGD